MKRKRRVDIVVISDIHLGTYGCRSKELLQYLKSIRPGTLVLNGDIIDIWQFNKHFFPKGHIRVVKYIMQLIGKGVRIYYIPGNHDETLRRFAGFKLGSFEIVNKVVLPLKNNEKAWIFHGDVFDVTMRYSKWLARLGAVGYDLLILINSLVNFISEKMLHRGRISLSKRIKNSVKSAVSFINQFEQTAAEIGIANKYEYVICGHIHHPEMREIRNEHGTIVYLNSGDWVENMSALEYNDGAWSIYRYSEDTSLHLSDPEDGLDEKNNRELFEHLLTEFNITRAE